MASLVRHPNHARSEFSRFRPDAGSSGRKEIWYRKSEDKQTCLLPQENQHTTMPKSRANSRAFLRFEHYEEVTEGGSESKKWREADLFVIPRKPREWMDHNAAGTFSLVCTF